MKSSSSTTVLPLLLIVVIASPGCKSMSWKLPGSSFFASNREPDAETLAGTTDVPSLPESPAAKYSPGTIASVGAQNPAGVTFPPNSNGSAYGYSAQTVSTPKTGLAAQANGYQTGPYQVGGVGQTAGLGGRTATTNTGAGASMPNPYGGNYSTAASTGAPNITLPSSVANTLSQGSAVSPSSYPGNNGTTTSPINYGTSNTTPSYPSQTQGTSTGTGSLGAGSLGTGSTGATSTGGTSGLPAYPGSTGRSSVPTYPSLPATSSNSSGGLPQYGSTGVSVGGAANSGYTPGTTGRNTSYNFGGATGQGTGTLPPNTANSSNPLLR